MKDYRIVVFEAGLKFKLTPIVPILLTFPSKDSNLFLPLNLTFLARPKATFCDALNARFASFCAGFESICQQFQDCLITVAKACRLYSLYP